MAEHESMVSPEELQEAHDVTVGKGTPATAPLEAPRVGVLDAQPAIVIGTGIVTAATAILTLPIPLPEWLTGILAAVVTVAGLFGIYSKVTPVAKPKLDQHTPLTP